MSWENLKRLMKPLELGRVGFEPFFTKAKGKGFAQKRK